MAFTGPPSDDGLRRLRWPRALLQATATLARHLSSDADLPDIRDPASRTRPRRQPRPPPRCHGPDGRAHAARVMGTGTYPGYTVNVPEGWYDFAGYHFVLKYPTAGARARPQRLGRGAGVPRPVPLAGPGVRSRAERRGARRGAGRPADARRDQADRRDPGRVQRPVPRAVRPGRPEIELVGPTSTRATSTRVALTTSRAGWATARATGMSRSLARSTDCGSSTSRGNAWWST